MTADQETEMGSSPYAGLPPDSFWRLGVAQHPPGPLAGLYRSRFSLTPEARIAVAGGCFAQAFARTLRATEATVLDCEPAPPGLSDELATRFGYNLFSARHGNIYFARQLRQLIEEAYGHRAAGDAVWERDGRYYDALRPSVEPQGLASPEEVGAHRQRHLLAVRKVLESVDVFVYALSLNEAWMHSETGTVYPTAPSTVAGSYNPEIHRWHAFDYAEVYADLEVVATMLREVNPGTRLLIMVSPVPGTATASDRHVLAANTQHKAILRAVAGAIWEELPFVDYFPAFELVATQFSRGQFYEPNLRAISPNGFAAIMETFLDQHPALGAASVQGSAVRQPASQPDEGDFGEAVNLCEDALLDAFSP